MSGRHWSVDRYWTVVVPHVPAQFATQWHPPVPCDHFTRGAFPTEADAIEWGRANLGGTPYTVRLVTE